MSDYLIGTDVIGALSIRFTDVPGMVKAKGGAAGSLAHTLAPATISEMAYSEMRKKMAEEFAKQGVPVELKMVSDGLPVATSGRDLATGAALGAAGVGVVYGLVKLVGLLFRKKSA